jgi:hypothetical protein
MYEKVWLIVRGNPVGDWLVCIVDNFKSFDYTCVVVSYGFYVELISEMQPMHFRIQ